MSVTLHAAAVKLHRPPFLAGDRLIFIRDPATRVTVTGCTLTATGWSVSWREEPEIKASTNPECPGKHADQGQEAFSIDAAPRIKLTPVTGCCPAEKLMPASALWMMSGAVCPVFRGPNITGSK